MAELLESKVLTAINDDGQIADSGDFAAKHALDHLTLVGVIKSLAASEMILVTVSSLCCMEARRQHDRPC